MKKIYTISPDSYSEQEVRTVCDKMEELFENGFYPHLEIFREYSKYNPRLTGRNGSPYSVSLVSKEGTIFGS